MNIVLKCERCDRPAPLKSQCTTIKMDCVQVDKQVERICVCGGRIVPTIE